MSYFCSIIRGDKEEKNTTTIVHEFPALPNVGDVLFLNAEEELGLQVVRRVIYANGYIGNDTPIDLWCVAERQFDYKIGFEYPLQIK